jgi:pseudaminic acid biosynthesis-associated methylase
VTTGRTATAKRAGAARRKRATKTVATGEIRRLESLWGGEFGQAYTDRNANAGAGRQKFWRSIVRLTRPQRVLEVGCNLGANLSAFTDVLPPRGLWGIDVNEHALARLRARLAGVNAVHGAARDLPFRDGWFDLTFTCGVLIHQPPQALPLVMSELVRVSRRFVLAAEYAAKEPTEVPYRGHSGALFKRDFGALYRELFPQLEQRRNGFLGRDQGFDDVTWWLFEKKA